MNLDRPTSKVRHRARQGLMVAICLVSCGSESHSLEVSVRTDLRAGVDFDRAEVMLGGEPTFELRARRGEDWSSVAQHVAAWELEAGGVVIVGRLVLEGEIVVERTLMVQVQGATHATISFSSFCGGSSAARCGTDGGTPPTDSGELRDALVADGDTTIDAATDASADTGMLLDSEVPDAGIEDASPDAGAAPDAGVAYDGGKASDGGDDADSSIATPCFGATDCGAAEYCDQAECTTIGTCRPRPLLCSPLAGSLCGCDGVIYANACEAQASGTSISKDGLACSGSSTP